MDDARAVIERYQALRAAGGPATAAASPSQAVAPASAQK